MTDRAGGLTQPRTYRMKALTDVWTGDASGRPERLIPTGLLGSIRWWFEVLVRGLDGSACDPSNSRVRCPDRDRRRCVVCELFGCTGWARKFRFDVLDASRQLKQEQITAGEVFELVFTPLRPVRPEEWALLDATIRLIADYGAVGGKTVYKPSDESRRENAPHHLDYGLVRIESRAKADRCDCERLRNYVVDARWRRVEHGKFGWASLKNLWSIKGRYLARESPTESAFNRILGRKEDKSVKEKRGRRVTRWSDLLDSRGDKTAAWLAGRQSESKKVFSFKQPDAARRTFGFARSKEELNQMRQRLKDQAWNKLRNGEFVTGDKILRELLGAGET